MLTLRKATMDDAEFLFRLRTDPETARNSLKPPPTPEKHQRWLEERLQDPTVKLYIAEVTTYPEASAPARLVPIGSGRLDCRKDRVWLSATMAPEHRGQGYAESLLDALVAEAKAINAPLVRATVKGDNIRSIRAFLAAGFTPMHDVELERTP